MRTQAAIRAQAANRAQAKPVKNISRRCKLCFQPSPISAVRCVKCGERFPKISKGIESAKVVGRIMILTLVGLMVLGFWVLIFK